MKSFSIAIDGPAGAGKSTVARLVAKRLGLTYIDTGAMYRALTLKAIEQAIDPSDGEALGRLARGTRIQLLSNPGSQATVLLDGRDVTKEVRNREVSALVGRIAAVPGVRETLVKCQREMAAAGSVVMEGRDIGTNVLCTAPYKFFLTAAPEVRALRRLGELPQSLSERERQQMVQEMIMRDRMDVEREINPLGIAPNAVIIDCTNLTAAQVVDFIAGHVAGKGC